MSKLLPEFYCCPELRRRSGILAYPCVSCSSAGCREGRLCRWGFLGEQPLGAACCVPLPVISTGSVPCPRCCWLWLFVSGPKPSSEWRDQATLSLPPWGRMSCCPATCPLNAMLAVWRSGGSGMSSLRQCTTTAMERTCTGSRCRAYAGRTELSRDGLSAGSLDLRITGLRPSDDGQYICTVGDADAYDEATVDLEVSASGADPHLSLGGYEDGGVRVLCRSAGWYPLPQLLWRDAHGQHLPLVSQTHSQDQEGLFEIKGAIIVTGSVEGPLSCVVRSSRLQQEWKFSLHIAAPFFHNAQPWKVALAVVLVLLAVSIGLGVYLFRKKGKLAVQGWRGGRCSAGTPLGVERG
uniref:Butyrophilin subfamily 3 member A2-like Ig-C domain-containing protein n=1 Tax=Anas platyrhynchos TaxID=8839 RepID=A0A8B9ZEV5_ANAPL